jgi:hypothetical protein
MLTVSNIAALNPGAFLAVFGLFTLRKLQGRKTNTPRNAKVWIYGICFFVIRADTLTNISPFLQTRQFVTY